LDAVMKHLLSLKEDMGPTLELAASLKFPAFERPTEYVALVSDSGEYPFLLGDIGSTEGVRVKPQDYKKVLTEYIDKRSSAKFAKMKKESYAVGSLSRFKLNHKKLLPDAQKVAAQVGLKPDCVNPYMNTVAQLVECVHCLEDAIAIVKKLQSGGVNYDEEILVGVNEKKNIPVRAGRGVGAVEVPRGLLIHDYEVDERGLIKSANCIIPTNQNISNIEYDMQKLAPEIIKKPQDEIRLAMEMLVRAYDPCISCSAHYLDVKFV
ncbi:MAG TPA: nickel-dependent hydrogenase large subunit, partial [Elusimicrobiales bacterium]|nr:nickel-dependent hydrogenase large subunit [Elusimicrobiales bacterium]